MTPEDMKVICDYLNHQMLGGEMQVIAEKLKAEIYAVEETEETPVEEEPKKVKKVTKKK